MIDTRIDEIVSKGKRIFTEILESFVTKASDIACMTDGQVGQQPFYPSMFLVLT